MRVKIAVSAVLAALTMAGAAIAQKNGMEFDRDADFSGYKTYDWVEHKQKPEGSPLAIGGALDTKIRNAIDRQLAAQGFVPNLEGKPDFLVSFDGAMEQITEIHPDRYELVPGVSWVSEGDINSYRKGTLIISISDAESGNRVWSAWTRNKIKNPDRPDEQVDRAVKRLLKKFPPRR